jgi:hypothetical protein
MDHTLATPSGQQAAPQLPSPHTNQEAPQQPLMSPPKDKEASQQPLPSSPTLKDKEAPQLPSTHTETEVSKDKETSPVQVMPPPHLVQSIHHHHLLMTQSTRSPNISLLVFTVIIHFVGMISYYVGCNSWTM